MLSYRHHTPLRRILPIFVALTGAFTAFPTATLCNSVLSGIEELHNSEIIVKGIVTDATTGQPIAGAHVAAHGAERFAVLTDENGTYSVSVPAFATLLDFSAPGYNLVQKSISSDCSVIGLFPELFDADYTSTSNIANNRTAEGFDLSASLSADEVIATRLGGAVRTIHRSGAPGMGDALFVSGIGSLYANAQPLIVVDGIYWNQQEHETLHDGFYPNVLAGISLADIERITVVKDATALYGAKGANGVILIDTKRSTSMATRIEASVQGGVEFVPRQMDMMGASDFRLYASELIGTTDTRLTSFRFLRDDPNYYFYPKYHNETRWSDYLYREALTQRYHIAVQGGDEVADYHLSLGYTDAQGTLQCNDFSRLNLRFNTDIKLAEHLKTRFDVAYSYSTRDLRNDGAPADYTTSTLLAPAFLGYIKAPFLSPYRYDEQGQITTQVEEADDFAEGLALNSSWANPVAVNVYGEARNKNFYETNDFRVTISPRWDVTPRLHASTLFSYSLMNAGERAFVPTTGVPVFYMEGMGESSNRASALTAKQESVFSHTNIVWNQTGDRYRLDLEGGFRFLSDGYTSAQLEGHNTGNDKTPDLVASLSYKQVSGIDNRWLTCAWYGQADYNWRYKYFLQGALTVESSSRFGAATEQGITMGGVRWGLFPSLQGAWLLSSERFFAEHVPAISYLKLHAGFDVSGNDDIDIAASQTGFVAGRYLGGAIGLTLGQLGNDAIQWESTRRFSVGMEARALADRLSISLSAFRAATSHLLTLKQLPAVTGESYYWSNGGSLRNVGADVRASAKLISARHWSWQLGVSAATYHNEVTALPDGDFTTPLYDGEVLTAVGHPVGVFYGYRTNGVYATTAEAETDGLYNTLSTGARSYFGGGDVRFVNLDDSPAIDDADKTIIGDPNPDLYGSVFTTVGYRRISLSADMSYSVGNDIYNYLRRQLESGSNFFNQTTALCRRWVGEGQRTDIPRASWGDPMGNARFSDRWIEDGSYLRLRQLTLSYQLPITSLWMQGITLSATASNLFTLTRYLGADPESSASNQVLMQGIDVGLVPQGRSLTLGIKLNL